MSKAQDEEITVEASHTPAICVRDVQSTQYVGKGYKSKFTCPSCGHNTWQHLSFLGQRTLICNGRSFTKETKK